MTRAAMQVTMRGMMQVLHLPAQAPMKMDTGTDIMKDTKPGMMRRKPMKAIKAARSPVSAIPRRPSRQARSPKRCTSPIQGRSTTAWDASTCVKAVSPFRSMMPSGRAIRPAPAAGDGRPVSCLPIRGGQFLCAGKFLRS